MVGLYITNVKQLLHSFSASAWTFCIFVLFYLCRQWYIYMWYRGGETGLGVVGMFVTSQIIRMVLWICMLEGKGEDSCSVVKLTSSQSCVLYVTRQSNPRNIHEAVPCLSLTCWPASWSSGQRFWLLITSSRVRFPALPWEFSLWGEDPRGDHGLGS